MIRIRRISKGKWAARASLNGRHCWRAGKNPVSAALTAVIGLLTWRVIGW